MGVFLLYYVYINRKVNMTDQTKWGIPEVQMKNREREYQRKNTINLHDAQDIYRSTNGLDNISELDMKKFRQIMLGSK